MSPSLPIHAVLPDLLAALRGSANAVLVAPPGAGKTTAVAPALLSEDWCSGQILLLSPRRLAARAAAERMAELAGEAVGRTIGYATRLDTKQSRETRILVVTEGIFVNRIQADPELSGISAVLFDEVHERSLDSDFGIALALDAQAALRPDLRLVAMSATLDGGRFSRLMDDAPVIESEGRSHPLELRYFGRKAEQRIEDAVAAAIRTALAEQAEGGVLAFLPGVAEIERTAERLADLPVLKLHGSLDPAEQRRAIAPQATRKIVLATSIAETSLTLDGIRIVVDSGLARRPRYDRAAGMTRLVTERASQAAATQRSGRAARQGAGVAYRLWEQAATAGMPPFDPPEIMEADLSALLLDCALWGVADPRDLRWIDSPPEAAIAEARARLAVLGALDADGRPTPHGKAMARLPLPPRLAHMLIAAGERGWGTTAAEVAVLLGERGLGGNDPDIEMRLRRWRSERGPRAEGARKLAKRWSGLIPPSASGRGLGGGRDLSTGRGADGVRPPPDPLPHAGGGACLALAFPDRVAKRRGADGADWISVGGRGFKLDPLSSLARETWLAVAETQGMAAGARILSAAPISEAEVMELFGDRVETRVTLRFDPDAGAVQARRERRLGAITLASGPADKVDADAVTATLVAGVRTHGPEVLPWTDAARALRARAGFAGIDLSDAVLLEQLEDMLAGKRKLSELDLHNALQSIIGWDGMRTLDRLAPTHLETPAGSRHAIDYDAEGGPAVDVRVQALFGMTTHPMAGSVPLTLRLTSPAGRPIQTTKDLPGFWAGSWNAVAKEMRGRYPKHPWPDDPAAALATLRTKKASQGRGG